MQRLHDFLLVYAYPANLREDQDLNSIKKLPQTIIYTAILTIGRICTQFMSFFLMPLYTAALSTEEYGVVDLVGTYTSLLLPVALLQIDQALFRFLIDKRNDEDGKKYVLTTAAIFSLAQVAVVIAVFLLFGRFICCRLFLM